MNDFYKLYNDLNERIYDLAEFLGEEGLFDTDFLLGFLAAWGEEREELPDEYSESDLQYISDIIANIRKIVNTIRSSEIAGVENLIAEAISIIQDLQSFARKIEPYCRQSVDDISVQLYTLVKKYGLREVACKWASVSTAIKNRFHLFNDILKEEKQ